MRVWFHGPDRLLSSLPKVPAGKLIHAIVDNYATHKHPNVMKWLARRACRRVNCIDELARLSLPLPPDGSTAPGGNVVRAHRPAPQGLRLRFVAAGSRLRTLTETYQTDLAIHVGPLSDAIQSLSCWRSPLELKFAERVLSRWFFSIKALALQEKTGFRFGGARAADAMDVPMLIHWPEDHQRRRPKRGSGGPYPPRHGVGPDSLRNGIALCGTVHWMFDRGLISIADYHELLPKQVMSLLKPDRRLPVPAFSSRSKDRGHPNERIVTSATCSQLFAKRERAPRRAPHEPRERNDCPREQ